MTKQKKVLLCCGIAIAPLLALVATLLRTIALFREFDKDTGYFHASAPTNRAYLIICAVAVLLFLAFAIIARRDLSTPTLGSGLSILFSAAYFLVTLAVSAISNFISTAGATTGLTKFFWIVSAVTALLAIAYFALFLIRAQSQGIRHGLLGMAPAFFALFTAILLYFDRSIQMNAPAKLLHMAAFLLLACYFLWESRALLGSVKNAPYYFVTAVTLLLSLSASIPNLLYNLIENGALVLSSIYDFVLLAAALYTLARLVQLFPYELPSTHRMVQQFLRSRAAEAADTPATDEAPAAEPSEAPVSEDTAGDTTEQA